MSGFRDMFAPEPVAPSSLQPPEGMEALDYDFNTLRHGMWNPLHLVNTIHASMESERGEGRHIWDSSEHHQAYAVGCWVAAARRVIADELISGANYATNQYGFIPTDTKQLATAMFEEAEKWRTFSFEVSNDVTYRTEQGFPDFRMEWPDPARERIPAHLFYGLKTILGLKDFISQLTNMTYAHVELEANGPHKKAIFRDYDKQVAQKKAILDRKIAALSQRWDKYLEPNREPGRSVYRDMVACVEGYVALGVHQLMPATLNPDMRLLVRKVEEPEEADIPVFDALQVMLHDRGGKPDLPTFDASAFQALSRSESPQSNTLQSATSDERLLPPFNPRSLLGEQPAADDSGETVREEVLPIFSGFSVLAEAVEGESTDEGGSEEAPDVGLPTFKGFESGDTASVADGPATSLPSFTGFENTSATADSDDNENTVDEAQSGTLPVFDAQKLKEE
jgi:hypothetical protein